MNPVYRLLAFVPLLHFLATALSFSQTEPPAKRLVKDFFYLEPETRQLPVFVRGDLSNKVVLLFVQGGPGETAIDYARADYPRWKNSLERHVAIAYYDQRGLNSKASRIDTAMVNYEQYSRDLFALARELKKRYEANVYLFAHSAGGRFVYHCLGNVQYYDDGLIAGAITVGAPFTTDFSPDRYRLYRPRYLKNLAKERIENGQDTAYWQEALDWMTATDSIGDPESARRWNAYVDSAFEPAKRKLGPGAALRVLFGRPYNPVKYLNKKDEDRVGDLLWEDSRDRDFFALVKKFQCQTLLITGRYDDIAPPEEMYHASGLSRYVRPKVIPDAGHEPFLDQPAAFQKAVLDFLDLP